MRLLAGFLVKRIDKRDFGPKEFGVHWDIPDTPEALALVEHWHTASSYVVHFSDDRVRLDLSAFPIGGLAFNAMATDALLVFRQFLERLETRVSERPGGLATVRSSSPINHPPCSVRRCRREDRTGLTI